MKSLNSEQLKALSSFFSAVAAAWFVAATVNPLFSQSQEVARSVLLAVVGIGAASLFMWIALGIIKEA